MPADFKKALDEADQALDRIVKGDPEGYKELYARGRDITLGNPFGGFGHGWDEVVEQLERAASYFRDGAAAPTEIITQVVEGNMASSSRSSARTRRSAANRRQAILHCGLRRSTAKR